MTNSLVKRNVRIWWNDAALYSPKNKIMELTRLETVGIVEKEDAHFIIIKNPKTIRCSNGTAHPKETPTYYFIPRGMIEKIEFM